MSTSKRVITTDDKKASIRLKHIYQSKKKSLGLNQEEVAKKLKVTQPFISQCMGGTVAMNTDIVLRLASILDIKPEEIRPDIFTRLNYTVVSQKQKIKVLYTSTGQKLKGTLMTVLANDLSKQAFAIRVEEHTYIPRICYGESVICDPSKKIKTKAEVVIRSKTGTIMLATVKREAKQHYTVTLLMGNETIKILKDAIEFIAEIVAIQKP